MIARAARQPAGDELAGIPYQTSKGMQMKKQLSDFPEYVRIRQTIDKLRSEEQEINARLEEIRVELSKPKQKIKIDGQDAWSLALEGKDQPSVEIDAES